MTAKRSSWSSRETPNTDFNTGSVAALVAFYITAAYWFTSSTSFANPAVTIARTLTNTFSGIQYGDTIPFIMAQIIGGLLAFLVFKYLSQSKRI